MTAKRALVTGGAGFLGSHLCDALLSDGYSVVAVDNLLTGRMANLEHLKNDSRFEFRKIDVNEPFDCGPVDYVFHFASPASPVDYHEHGIATLKVGSLGTFHALDVAKKYGAKYLIASTSECYGDPLEHPQKETYWGHVNPIGPRSVYDESKRFAEAATMVTALSTPGDPPKVRATGLEEAMKAWRIALVSIGVLALALHAVAQAEQYGSDSAPIHITWQMQPTQSPKSSSRRAQPPNPKVLSSRIAMSSRISSLWSARY